MRSVDEQKQLVERDCMELSLSEQLEVLSISKSSFYYVSVGENKENLEIMRLLDEQYFRTPFYGVLRLTALLREKGYRANSKRVRRLMKIMNWQTIYREPKTTLIEKGSYKYPYLLKGLEITKVNQVWAMDNIFIERLWRSVKYEHIYLNIYEDGLSLWKGLSEYLQFYNGERLHQSLDYKTPETVYKTAA
ncbi:MAG: IS3 family transposase [Paludibacteraceae bacterium]